MIVSKKFDSADIIASSQFVIAYSSFAVAQALAAGKPVLIIDWLHKPERPDYFDLPLARKIDKAADLADNMIEMMSNQTEISSDFISRFEDFFQPESEPVAGIYE